MAVVCMPGPRPQRRVHRFMFDLTYRGSSAKGLVHSSLQRFNSRCRPLHLTETAIKMNANTAIRQLQRASRQLYRQHHAPFRIPNLRNTRRGLHVRASPQSLLQKRVLPSRIANQIRNESTETSQRPLTDRPSSEEASTTTTKTTTESEEIADRQAQEPAYELTFTCRKCMERSSHRITKQAYHFGTTLITCPGCKSRHLISDHLKIFSDRGVTIEDILKEKGEFLRKGRLGEDGDIEFYDEANNEIGQQMQAKEKE